MVNQNEDTTEQEEEPVVDTLYPSKQNLSDASKLKSNPILLNDIESAQDHKDFKNVQTSPLH